jgi:hypothetical protein
MNALSKKLTVMLATAFLLLANDAMGSPFSAETLETVCKFLIIPYLVSQGYADGSAGGSTRLVMKAAKELKGKSNG